MPKPTQQACRLSLLRIHNARDGREPLKWPRMATRGAPIEKAAIAHCGQCKVALDPHSASACDALKLHPTTRGLLVPTHDRPTSSTFSLLALRSRQDGLLQDGEQGSAGQRGVGRPPRRASACRRDRSGRCQCQFWLYEHADRASGVSRQPGIVPKHPNGREWRPAPRSEFIGASGHEAQLQRW